MGAVVDDVAPAKEKPSLARTLSRKFGKVGKDDVGDGPGSASVEAGEDATKPALGRTLSQRFAKEVASEDGTVRKDKPSLGRTISAKFGKKDALTGEDRRPKKLRTEFRVVVRNVTKTPINNTTVCGRDGAAPRGLVH